MAALSSEHIEQRTFVAVVRELPHPAGRVLLAIPNGFLKTKTMRIRAWQEGMLAGAADIFVPWPVAPFHGLFLEFKSSGGTLSREQRWFLREMERLGYRTGVPRSWQQGLEIYCDYLGIEISR